MYIKRHAEDTVRQMAKQFGAVLVTGPRQVGKTTMLENLLGNISHVTMDDAILRTSAAENQNTFLKDFPPPVFIDEIQKAPNLFEQIKIYLDSDHKKGQFYLSGSQQFKVMKQVSESLAGRIGILNLLGLSLREITGISERVPFIPTDDYFSLRRNSPADVDYDGIWNLIWRGSMPEMVANQDYDWRMYYGSYVTTYVERDVRDLAQVGDEVKFMRFMAVMAARNGQLLNLQSAANDVGISLPTADRWLSILSASHIVYLLRPYANNLINRAVKTPKLYFLDTGLAAYLSRWNTVDTLKNGAMAGEFFEAFVLSEIVKSYYNRGILEPPLYFYRDKDKKEIDILIEEGDILYPLEIKKHADPNIHDITNFSILDRIGKRGPGGVICLYDHLMTLRGTDRVIPVNYL